MDEKLFQDFFLGRCTAEECRRVERWFIDNLDDSELDEMSMRILDKLGAYEDREQARQAYRSFRRRVGAEEMSVSGRLLRLWRRYAGYAAAAVVCAAAATVAYHIDSAGAEHPAAMPARLVELASRGTANVETWLPDSTRVVLRPGSRIVYDAASFGLDRQVMLLGDAFFDVRHSPSDASFRVKCSDASIEVIGTQFDVNSHDADAEFQVLLYKGSIRLASGFNNHSDTITLHPGEIVKVDKATGALATMYLDAIDADAAAGAYVFIDKPLRDIINSLSRYTGTPIVLSNPSLAGVKFFAIFNNGETPLEILTSLSETNSMTVRQDAASGTIEIL